MFEDLVEDGWEVSVNTVAVSMRRQGLVARTAKRKRRGLTRPDKAAAPIGDLVNATSRLRRLIRSGVGI